MLHLYQLDNQCLRFQVKSMIFASIFMQGKWNALIVSKLIIFLEVGNILDIFEILYQFVHIDAASSNRDWSRFISSTFNISTGIPSIPGELLVSRILMALMISSVSCGIKCLFVSFKACPVIFPSTVWSIHLCAWGLSNSALLDLQQT